MKIPSRLWRHHDRLTRAKRRVGSSTRQRGGQQEVMRSDSDHVGARPIRLCIVDMNNAHVNQAMRCLRGIAAAFFDRVREVNPGV